MLQRVAPLPIGGAPACLGTCLRYLYLPLTVPTLNPCYVTYLVTCACDGARYEQQCVLHVLTLNLVHGPPPHYLVFYVPHNANNLQCLGINTVKLTYMP